MLNKNVKNDELDQILSDFEIATNGFPTEKSLKLFTDCYPEYADEITSYAEASLFCFMNSSDEVPSQELLDKGYEQALKVLNDHKKLNLYHGPTKDDKDGEIYFLEDGSTK